MTNGESRTDYGWRGAWGRSSRSGNQPTPPGTPEHGSAPDSRDVESQDLGPQVPDFVTPDRPASEHSPELPHESAHESAREPEHDPGAPAVHDDADASGDQRSQDARPDETHDETHDAAPTDEAPHEPESDVEAASDTTDTTDQAAVADATDAAGDDHDDDDDGDGPPPPVAPEQAPLKRRPLPRVIALANQKGGVGKTTTTINLGAALAEDDHRVLIVDLDPQGNATTGLGINSRALDYSIYDVLLAEVPLEDCVESTSVRNLFIAPASLDLAGAEIELVPAMSREMRLRNAINRVKEDYDYILIDCPPSLGLLTVNALAAADEVMVPIQCEYYALEGLGQLIRNINLVQRNLNTSLELSSIILVMYDGRTKLAEQVSTEVREHFGNVVCRNVIPRNIRLSEAPSYGQPITTFDPSSRGAVAYRELAREVHRVST